jgi:HK97 gp10 family phage protein
MVLEMAIKLANQAKLLAPVDLGQLRNSISVATKNQTGIELNKHAGEKAPPLEQTGLKEAEAYVGSNVEHATHQEYGTMYQKAQPFLRPAKELVMDGATAEQVMKKWSNEEMAKVVR